MKVDKMMCFKILLLVIAVWNTIESKPHYLNYEAIARDLDTFPVIINKNVPMSPREMRFMALFNDELDKLQQNENLAKFL
uniref:Hemocyanin_C domain-containing protein n=1 Tax=Strongyloides papillosus TaxID=174720 RepID=A0A0N5BTT7_STREA